LESEGSQPAEPTKSDLANQKHVTYHSVDLLCILPKTYDVGCVEKCIDRRLR
jgi:hypothetical protein